MTTKSICHDGHCQPIRKENKAGDSKLTSVGPFINGAFILFLITLIALAICEALVEIFTYR
ncbi:hypothetical protein UFO1_2135 [Pelosinus sp. UFO1]|nr:hypothetical protein UFO1_2135 [Pelosinus sp. UFO1]